jgi:hypothetical protein
VNPRKLLQRALQSPNNFRFADACTLAEACQLVERHNLEIGDAE